MHSLLLEGISYFTEGGHFHDHFRFTKRRKNIMADTSGNNEKNVKGLTEKEEEYLKCLDIEFKDRYTEADEEYKRVWESDLPTPPIFLNMDKITDKKPDNYHRQKRFNPYNRDNRNRWRGYGRWD